MKGFKRLLKKRKPLSSPRLFPLSHQSTTLKSRRILNDVYYVQPEVTVDGMWVSLPFSFFKHFSFRVNTGILKFYRNISVETVKEGCL